METMSHFVTPIFNGENYDFWRIKMKTIFQTKKLWEIVEEGTPQPPTQEDFSPESIQQKSRYDEAIIKDLMALQIIQSAVSDIMFPRIAPAVTSKEAWDALKTEFQGTPQVRMIKLQSLRRDYENMKMNEDDDINSFTTKLIEIGNQLRVHGETKSDYHIVQKILISLPAKFDNIVSVLEQTKDLTTLSVTELIGTLKAHEKRIELREERSTEGAFYLKSKGGNFESKQGENHQQWSTRWCGVCKRNNHNESDCWIKKNRTTRLQNQTNDEKKCFICNKTGHFAKKCKFREREKANLSVEETDDEEDNGSHMLFSASEEGSSMNDETWLVDSGCTNHMTKEVKYFITLDRSIRVPIKVGNGQLVMTTGKGDIQVMTNHGEKIIKDVFLVPGLARNLLSVPQMVSNGYGVLFENNRCLVHDSKGRRIVNIRMRQKSFPFRWRNSKMNVLMANEEENDTSKLWHRRLGHTGFEKIKKMQALKMVDDLPRFTVTKRICDSCEMGKQARKSFPKKSLTRSSEVLELIHSDVCGPMQTESMSGSRYFLLFIDDYTKMSWVYFIKHKSEVFSKFKIFKSLVENQTGKKIKQIRTDGGGEFTSTEFIKMCQESGIHKQVTTPYSPQQNGVSERKNRTLVEMARSILADQNLPTKLWAEAVATSTYIQNRLPTKSLEESITPIEKWSGRKPSLKNLRVFGCICYVHVPDEKRKKFDVKSKRGIFIGYSTESKGYRILTIDEEKVEISQDVVFDEENQWDWEKKEVKKVLTSSTDTTFQENQQEGQLEQGRDVDLHNSIEDVGEEDSPNRPRRFRSINEIMQETGPVNETQTHEAYLMSNAEPQSFEEAVNEREWREAMQEEIQMIEKNATWSLVKRPNNKNVVSCKWIFRRKTNASGVPIKCKARLVARGFTQEYGVDYLETFAPVSRHDTIRTLLAVAAQKKWRLYQMDVKSAFLNGDLHEEIYVSQPPGFIRSGEEDMVLRLKKALYGLKQAPRAWYGRIDTYFVQNGFQRSVNDAALYVKNKNKDILVISLYVDDIIITGNNLQLINNFKEDMKREFEMTDLGELSFFLGMEIIQDAEGVFLSQEKYANKLLEKFGMKESKSVSTPLIAIRKNQEEEEGKFADETKYRSIVGGLLYLCASRPDLMYASSYLSRYMSSPLNKHYQEAKRVLCYVKGTTAYGIQFQTITNPELHGYSDNDWGGSIKDKKSTSGYVFTLGSAVFCWQSSKQQTIAQSTAEAEYIALCSATNQAIWLQRLVKEIGFTDHEGVKIYCDNKSAIAIGKNPVQHRRTKHIDIKYHFVREAEQKGLIKLDYCPGEVQVADILTKPLHTSRFEALRDKLGVKKKQN